MKKILISIAIIFSIIILSACSKENEQIIEKSLKNADKIEIINFHATYQCYSCVYIGDIMFKIIEKNFKEEYQNGKIILKKIDVDKSENKDIVNKYEARGSSLFFNFITNDIEKIEEDTNIWRLVGNDQAFENYIIKKIRDNLK